MLVRNSSFGWFLGNVMTFALAMEPTAELFLPQSGVLCPFHQPWQIPSYSVIV